VKLWEIAGWLLLLIGLYIFYVCFGLLIEQPPRFIQSIPLVTIGVVVFRGGLHLLKVAAAAQTCRLMQLSSEGKPAKPIVIAPPPARPTRTSDTVPAPVRAQ
jgi:hypothetical protein